PLPASSGANDDAPRHKFSAIPPFSVNRQPRFRKLTPGQHGQTSRKTGKLLIQFAASMLVPAEHNDAAFASDLPSWLTNRDGAPGLNQSCAPPRSTPKNRSTSQ